ncbi:hypothetical protein ACFONL_06680 [Camelimonas fluminis]|uniref:Transposase n=1 Tax=Camelimonas fluminis TaxID=1576911 RepID=A0ABV7UEZ8_9HYPH
MKIMTYRQLLAMDIGHERRSGRAAADHAAKSGGFKTGNQTESHVFP